MRRKQLRLQEFDYSAAGAYFITVCVQDKVSLLSRITDQVTSLLPAGELVAQGWNELPLHYSNIELDEFVVMPNHIHGLIWILPAHTDNVDVGAGFKPALLPGTV